MSSKGIEEAIRRIADRGVAWVQLGTVTEIETHTAFGYLLTCKIQPSGKLVQTRMLSIGASSLEGMYWPVQVDDEVVILFPDGDYNNGISLGPLNSRAAQIPTDWANSNVCMTQAGGFQFRRTDGAVVNQVVLETLLPDLLDSIAEIQTVINGLGIATPNTASLVAKLPNSYRSSSVETD